MAHSAMPGVQRCSGIRSLVWSRVSQGGLVRSESGKDNPTILVITNFIVVGVEPVYPIIWLFFDILPERLDQSKLPFCRQTRETRFNGKFKM